jgi:hypothetical protein
MTNFSLIPNTTTTCNSIDKCVNDMCQLGNTEGVGMVCFMSNGDYIQTSDLIKPLLLAISIILFIYSIVITWMFYNHTTKNKVYENVHA